MVNLSLGDEYSVIIDRLSETIKEHFARADTSQVDSIIAFARYFYSTAPLEELSSRRNEDLYGATVALWRFLQLRPDNKPLIKVYNPRFEDHGWQSTHTVVEVLVKDSVFIVDSLMMMFVRFGISLHSVTNAVFSIERNHEGELVHVDFTGKSEGCSRDALLHFEIDKQSDESAMIPIVDEIMNVLANLDQAVIDFPSMVTLTKDITDKLDSDQLKGNLTKQHVETVEFLRWLTRNSFTFLGMKEYRITDQGELDAVPGSSLGISALSDTIELMENAGGQLVLGDQLLVFAKSGAKSIIHRPAYMDFIAIRTLDGDGNIVSEHRIVGLYTSRVFNNSPQSFPIIGRKIEDVIKRSGLTQNSYNGKHLIQILETFPREELFQISTDDLLKTAVGILQIQERRRLRLFVRKGEFGRFISCLIYTPREGFSSSLRKKFQQVLCEYVKALDLEFNTSFSESNLARIYVVIRVDSDSCIDFDVAEVQARLVDLARSWSDKLFETLIEAFGETRANNLFGKYSDAFSIGYRDEFTTRTAVSDIEHIETLTEENQLSVSFYRVLEEDSLSLRFKIFRLNKDIPLSDLLPMLEHLGLHVLGGRPYRVDSKAGLSVWIYDFSVRYGDERHVEIDQVKHNFQDAFYQVWNGVAENDGFNELILAVGLDWRAVAMLRAYAKYLKQTGFSFSQYYIKNALISQPAITQLLVDFFNARFSIDLPVGENASPQSEDALIAKISDGLELVESLDEDRILRRYLDVMSGTLRTNYFQKDNQGNYKSYFSFKISPREIPDLPKPLPLYEIFVYSPRVEGIHLRSGKVARGGLRWSDRMEDYRTEVLGLVKAQQVKNAVIVPVGAKGGFVAKRLPKSGRREDVMAEVIACYETFIRGLLDITDNLIKGEVIPPPDVIRKDDDDTYLVVAADKGTATFSDIANRISQEYNFWLGDAFASGGSIGYDHKKMGITAKGAWVSVQRHFRELGVDVQHDPVTVVGIGDMSGDVFGNGLLQSRATKLVAAFNHMHVFIDPNPDPEASYCERERLFRLPRSGWNDYNKELISTGGGVFLRTLKSIQITPQMKECFAIKADYLTPNELVTALLKAPIDLLWNGGIGTYIKSSSELHADAGDKSNDAVRVDGKQVRAKVIGEGGNLGVTQLGRVEYCLLGGRANTDFIDNAGGVDCSDHEVNIKILLNDVVSNGDMTLKQRRELLADMTDNVSELVLENNYRQALAISIAQAESAYRMGEYKRYIHALVQAGRLDRELEFIPSDEELHERTVNGQGLTRPELSVLLSYTKATIKEELVNSSVPNDRYIRQQIETAFPTLVVEKYPDEIYSHKLRREIIATQVANELVNYMGITFACRMMDAAGSDIPNIAKAFVAARDVYSLRSWWSQINTMDHHPDALFQIELMRILIRLTRRAARWFLRNNRCGVDVSGVIKRFQPGIKTISDNLSVVLQGPRLLEWEKCFNDYIEKGVPSQLATFIAGADSMLPALGIIQASEITDKPVTEVAAVYFAIGTKLDLFGFYEEINNLTVENHWQALAREAYRDDLDWQQRTLTVGVLNMSTEAKSTAERIQAWVDQHSTLIERWKTMMAEFRSTDIKEFSMYGVALRELMDIAQTTLYMEESICPVGRDSV